MFFHLCLCRPLVEASARILKQYVQVFNVPVLKDAVTEYVIYGLNKSKFVFNKRLLNSACSS